jgi:hypothetical protein
MDEPTSLPSVIRRLLHARRLCRWSGAPWLGVGRALPVNITHQVKAHRVRC